MIECPNEKCILKNTKDKLYLPLTQEWSHGDKQVIHDRVFLIYFILSVMSFFISQNFFCADMLINISYYYLKIIGNYCLCMYYYKKVKEMELSTQEKFEFKRLSFAILKELIDKLKTPNEACYSLEDLNVSYYFKYEELSIKHKIKILKDSFPKDEVLYDGEYISDISSYLKDNGKYKIILYYKKFFTTTKVRFEVEVSDDKKSK